jgi:hypothetical protein
MAADETELTALRRRERLSAKFKHHTAGQTKTESDRLLVKLVAGDRYAEAGTGVRCNPGLANMTTSSLDN